MNVVAVLEVTVPVVDVVNVIAVGDHLAAVTLSVSARVAGVRCLLGMTLVAVHVVNMVVVPDGLAPVARMVFVIDGLSMGSHLSSLPAVRGLLRTDAGRRVVPRARAGYCEAAPDAYPG